MSSIRVFILGSLAERGEMHGHQLRLLAEQENIHLWTDFTVGGIYGAIKRLAAEGLIAGVRTEREGNRPERQVYEITPAGRESLRSMIQETLNRYTLRPDPFDLALTRLDPRSVDDLPRILAARRQSLDATLVADRLHLAEIEQYLTVAETHAMTHRRFRLQAELDWLDSVIVALPQIIADEKSRKDS